MLGEEIVPAMDKMRRKFVANLLGTGALASIMLTGPKPAKACLGGTWKVRCPKGHIDTVTRGTCQHVCETCGLQVFSGDDVTVVCRNGHPTRITTDRTTSFMCPVCHTDCQLQPPPPKERPNAR
jgi:hypothetical protein